MSGEHTVVYDMTDWTTLPGRYNFLEASVWTHDNCESSCLPIDGLWRFEDAQEAVMFALANTVIDNF